MKITLHPDWQLIEDLEKDGSELSIKAALLIKELKRELALERDKRSRLEFPDTTGQ